MNIRSCVPMASLLIAVGVTLLVWLAPLAVSAEVAPTTVPSGFVRCDSTHFALDGKHFPVVGANCHYLPWGSQAEVRHNLEDAAQLHFTVVRTFLAGIRGSLDGKTKPTIWGWPNAKDSANMDLHGVYSIYWDTAHDGIGFNDGPDGLERLDFVIAEAGKLGLRLNIGFMDFWQYDGGSQQMRAWYGSLGNLGATGMVPVQSGPDERYSFFFTDERTRRDYKQLVQHVLTRRNTITHILYKDDPTIFAWDLMNEPEFASGKIGGDWITEMASYVKSIDANHLLCAGTEGLPNADPQDTKAQLLIPQIDFGTFHTYPIYHHLSWQAVVALIHRQAALARAVNKPMVMQEFGYGANNPDQREVYRAWLAAANGADGIAGWLAWRLTSLMDNGALAADNGEHFDFHVNTPVSAVLSEAAQAAANPEASTGSKASIDISAAKFANRGSGLADTRGWYLVDGSAAGGDKGNGEEIPKDNNGIPATKLSGAAGCYVQALRQTGGFFGQSITAGPWIDYDLPIDAPGRYLLTAAVAGPDTHSDTLFVQIVGPDGKAVSAGDANWYRIHASSDGKFVPRSQGGLGKLDHDGGDVDMVWDLAAGNYKIHFVARVDGIALGAFHLALVKGGGNSSSQPADPAASAGKPGEDIAAEKFAGRGAGLGDNRSWYLVDGATAGGDKGTGEEIPKDNGGIPATKLSGAPSRYAQALRHTGGFYGQSVTAGPWIDYDLRIDAPGRYQLSAQVAGPDGHGDTLFVQIIGPDGKAVSAGDADWYRIQASDDGKFVGRTKGGLGKLDHDGGDVDMVWNLAAGNYKVHFVARVDGVALGTFRIALIKADAGTVTPSAANPAARPWAPEYKLKPEETGRLTAADVVGPDGIVYPDWHYAGVPGGIPQVPVRVRLEDFGAKPDNDQDASAALVAAAKAVAAKGGGAIELAVGHYTLANPVIIPYDNVVIRGQGAERTTIVSTYRGSDTIGFFTVHDGDVLGPDDWVQVHFNPAGIKGFKIFVGTRLMYESRYQPEWGGKFSTGFRAQRLAQYAANGGPLELIAAGEWSNGKTDRQSIKIAYDPNHKIPEGQCRHPFLQHLAVINFAGDAYGGSTWKLTSDGKRGDVTLDLESTPELKPGDAICLDAPATDRWNNLVKNACRQWGDFRRYEFRVQAVDGKRITLNQPLRIDFPTVDGSYVQKLYPIHGCGVEGFTITQPTSPLWTTAVLFSNAWECWARDIHTRKVGRHAVYVEAAKWCEFRDCDIQESWDYGVNGTAYVGWEKAYDCLMENVAVRHMRHGPLLQWSASGNVIRNSRFDGTDMQWHSGWTSENLFENCTVNAIGTDGTYGCGGWVSPPNDVSHGPNGPRNVVYNCDVQASRDGIWLGGMNEGWIIAYNRFHMNGEKPGIAALPFTFDMIVRGNVFSFTSPNQPGLVLSDPSCVGWEIVGNQIFGGNGKLTEGPGVPDLVRDNVINPPNPDAPRPVPAVPSIFEWQRTKR